jgi:hypothetical protein
VDYFPSRNIIEQYGVITLYQYFSNWSWVYHFNFACAFFDNLHLLEVGAIKVAHSQLSVLVQHTHLVLRYEDGGQCVVTTLFIGTPNCLEVLLELINYKTTTFDVKV